MSISGIIKNPILVIIGLSIFVILYLSAQKETLTTQQEEIIKNCTPTFVDGGGPYYKPNAPFRNNIAPEAHDGETLIVEGRLVKSDCTTPITDAELDVWQANETGNYEDEWYRGRLRTGKNGEYSFQTVVPKGYGEGTGYRPPHIHFKVRSGGEEIITSQMFFPEVKGRAGFDDAYIMKVETEQKNGKPLHRGYHDIVLP